MNMVRIEHLPAYYKQTKLTDCRFFQEIFSEGKKFDELKHDVDNKRTLYNSNFFDSIYLYESFQFLKRSMINLMAYRHLLAGNHLPMAKVCLYYSYFDSANCLLRIRGFALVHISETPRNFDDAPRQLRFIVTQHENHTFSLSRSGKNEHQLVWNIFRDFFPNLSSKSDVTWYTQDRYEWNYSLLRISSAIRLIEQEIRDRNENNFLDPNFFNAYTSGESEYKVDLFSNYGYEEYRAGTLIQEGIKLLGDIAKASKYKKDYLKLFSELKQAVNFVDGNQNTKFEINRWLDNALSELGVR